MNEFLHRVYFGNAVQTYLISLAVIGMGTLILALFKRRTLERLKRWAGSTQNTTDDAVVDTVGRFGVPALYYVIVYFGLSFITLSPKASRVIEIAVAVVVTYFVLRLVASIILLALQFKIRRQERGEEKIKQLGGLMILINMIIWILGILFLADNLGYDVTTIIAGLGIGGIAVALAAQNILGDLFNYFVIFFDRPFEVGDFIVVDDKMGTIEYIGIKTTRIRCLSGEQLVIGNSNLAASRIHNFKRMEKRRVVFSLNVDYSTPLEKVEQIPGIIRNIIEQQKPVAVDRVHFASYGDWSLRFEAVYFVLDADYNKYMDIQQRVNLRILEEFQKHQISFALPTQKMLLTNGLQTEEADR
jgi:small-conductance mechanosensitive channel